MDLYSIQVSIQSGWSTYLEPTSDVLALHDTLTRLRHEGVACRLMKCKVMREYPVEPEEREVLHMAADRMYDAIRAASSARDMSRAIDACNRMADDYDAALSQVTPELAARVRRTL
jgi:aspartate aminotransferase-like enzyme